MVTVTTPADAPTGARSLTTLTEHDNYTDAQATVDSLSDSGFPVEHLAIVGSDLVTFENVTGRRRYGRAALSGAASGAFIGAFLGVLFSLFAIFPTLLGLLTMVLLWAAIGAVAGAVAGLIGHALQGGQRDFSSVQAMTPTRYQVLVTPDRLEDALSHLRPSGN